MSADNSGLLASLTQLLQQLEAAQGGAPDPEARARLDQLRTQLGALEEAQERAHHEAGSPRHGHASGGSGSALGPSNGGSAVAGGLPAQGDTAAMLQQMDGLARRLSGLEHQLESLDEGTKEVLRQSAGGWLGALGDAVQDAAAPIEEAAAAAGAAENGGGAAGSQQGGGGQ